ncbi:MAG: hypothetical protein DSM106950_26680 [Stigonema ocellatum SAG 48.90 = DSM 106950]|nr:hypothetical protein [Stigonema ocellatum SAG 48.90 = DSM 106950]
MRKLPQCASCQFYAHDPHIVCALHPAGPGGDTCLDFRTDPDLDDKQTFENPYSLSHNQEQWEPCSSSYYNGELIVQPRQRWTQEQQLELLDNHPMFTGKCPQCGAFFDRDYTARVHWDCPECGWMDDVV